MKQLFKKGLILAAVLVFLPTLAGAVPFEFYNNNSTLAAIVEVEKSGPVGGLYTYAYTVRNVGFDPDNDGPDAISFLTIPVWDPALAFGSVAGDGVNILNIGITSPPLVLGSSVMVPGTFTVEFDDIAAGFTSDTFWLRSVLNEGLVIATLKDTTEETSANLITALSAPGNHGAEVPEPATLLLLGSGLLGMAGYRMWSKKGNE